jgi:hypothetical protein
MQNITLHIRGQQLVNAAIKEDYDIYYAPSIHPLIDYRVRRTTNPTSFTWHAQVRYALYQSQKGGGSSPIW